MPTVRSLEEVREAIDKVPNEQVKRALTSFVDTAGNDVNKVRENIEAWFDSSMDRVSGWYKRRTQWILVVLGLAVSIALNVNTLTIAYHLWRDPPLRNLLVAQAQANVQQQSGSNNTGTAGDRLKDNQEALEALGLPIGWSNVDFKLDDKWTEKDERGNSLFLWNLLYWVFWPLLGWILTAGAISFGAPFWFDLLNKFMVVRSTVKPHEKGPEEASEDRQRHVKPSPTYLGATEPRSLGTGSATPESFQPHEWTQGNPQEGIV